MEKEGSKRVEIMGFGDKRQIMVVFVGVLSGVFIKLQVIYKGIIDKLYFQIWESFVEGWDIIYFVNYWVNGEICFR